MSDRYSIARRDKKIAGVCATAGEVLNLDPTILRIGFAATALLISWKLALIAYVVAYFYFRGQRRRAEDSVNRPSELERMERAGRVRPSIHNLRTQLDSTDRRLMAIDHHLAQQKNSELALEIDALKGEK